MNTLINTYERPAGTCDGSELNWNTLGVPVWVTVPSSRPAGRGATMAEGTSSGPAVLPGSALRSAEEQRLSSSGLADGAGAGRRDGRSALIHSPAAAPLAPAFRGAALRRHNSTTVKMDHPQNTQERLTLLRDHLDSYTLIVCCTYSWHFTIVLRNGLT